MRMVSKGGGWRGLGRGKVGGRQEEGEEFGEFGVICGGVGLGSDVADVPISPYIWVGYEGRAPPIPERACGPTVRALTPTAAHVGEQQPASELRQRGSCGCGKAADPELPPVSMLGRSKAMRRASS